MVRAALLSLVVVGWGGLCRAGVVMFVPDVTVQSQPGSAVNGFFEVYLQASGSPVSAQNVQALLNLTSSSSGVTFSGAATTTTDHTMLFSTGFVSPLSSQDPNTGYRISAFAQNSSFSDATLTNGAGIMRVPFTVAPGTVGTFNIDVDNDPYTGTLFYSFTALDYVPVDFHNGSITVTAAPTAVPLPPAVLAGGGLMGLLGVRRWWRSRTNPLG